MPTKPKGLEKLGLYDFNDFLLHLPLRYEDATEVITVATALQAYFTDPTKIVQIEGTVRYSEIIIKHKRMWHVLLSDQNNDTLELKFFNFYTSQVNKIVVGQKLRARGPLKVVQGCAIMLHPQYHSAEKPLPKALTPIYPTTAGVSQTALQKMVAQALNKLPLEETLSLELRKKYQLLDINQALITLHQPSVDEDLAALDDRSHKAWQRIKFDELLAQQLSLKLAQERRRKLRAQPFSQPFNGTIYQQLENILPFTLTDAQKRVIKEIAADVAKPYPMLRLLQGDVGSGKTVVATYAAAIALDNGFQVALMAPTAILAEQHFKKISQWLEPLGINVCWLIGKQTKAQKNLRQEAIQQGTAHLVIGTHALIQENVVFKKLGLAIVDEQHRFGVSQRQALQHLENYQPHLLMMSATPIPRSLAMSYLADLELSTIDQLPPGRKPIITKVLSAKRRQEVIDRVEKMMCKGAQIYWVCPLIEESEKLDLNAANDLFTTLQEALPHYHLALIHGKLKDQEKSQIMADFAANTVQMLVATTVIEVGVDVPNANIMIIENAERFGLSQLHQLRGRIGRGADQATCILLYQDPLSHNAKERLRIMYQCCDGFEIARQDLAIRGPGEFLGAKQSGAALMRFADLENDVELLSLVGDAANLILEQSKKETNNPSHKKNIKNHIHRWLARKVFYLES